MRQIILSILGGMFLVACGDSEPAPPISCRVTERLDVNERLAFSYQSGAVSRVDRYDLEEGDVTSWIFQYEPGLVRVLFTNAASSVGAVVPNGAQQQITVNERGDPTESRFIGTSFQSVQQKVVYQESAPQYMIMTRSDIPTNILRDSLVVNEIKDDNITRITSYVFNNSTRGFDLVGVYEFTYSATGLNPFYRVIYRPGIDPVMVGYFSKNDLSSVRFLQGNTVVLSCVNESQFNEYAYPVSATSDCLIDGLVTTYQYECSN